MADLLSNPLYYITPLVGAFISLCLIVLVLRQNHRNRANQIFALLLGSLGCWAIFVFAMRASPDVEHALIWNRMVFPAGFALFIFYYHFTCAYTRTTNKKLLWGAYLLLTLVSAISASGLLMSHMTVESYGYAPHFYPSIYFISIGGFLFLAMALQNLLRAFRSTTRYEERTRLSYMISVIIIPLVFGLVDFIPSLPPIGIFGNILFSLFTAIVILKYHLLDIYIVARKGITYLLMSMIVAVPYVGVLLIFNRFFGGSNIPFFAHFSLLLSIALTLQIVWRGGQRVVDRLFYRERYDFLKALEGFSREPHDISDIKRLGSSLVRLIDLALQTSGVHLLLLSESDDFTVIASTNKNVAQLTLRSHSPLIQWLWSNKGFLHQRELDIIPQLQSLSARERNQIDVMEAELFIPLKTQKDDLVGVLILGKTLSGQPYSNEDERLILTVASRVAIELENARLYNIETMMRQELQKQDEEKTEFLHSVAHELKTPLTAIISSSELISAAADSATPSQRERLIANINRSAWLMDKRVAELLDLAKVQIGTLELNLEPTEIGTLINEVASQLGSIFNMKNQVLALELPEFLSPANADRERIEQVLLNLLSNANKFSPSDSRIVLRASEISNKILVEVQDSAPIISKEDRGKLFDPYYRGGDSDERSRIQGLGLGLAISKRLIELHRGKIWVESESGTGNSFIFSIPVWSGKPGEKDGAIHFNGIGGNLESINHRR